MIADPFLEHAYGMISDCTFCFVATNDSSGAINSRIVETLERQRDFTVRFMTHIRTRKVADMRHRSAVSLSFLSLTDRGYVTIGGAPQISNEIDLKRRLWKDSLLRWFPNGADDPDVVTVTCRPHWVELWSLSRGVAPAPVGLSSVRLTRHAEAWEMSETFPRP